MRRTVVAVLCAVAPLCTWRVASAGSSESTDPSTTSSTTTIPAATTAPPDASSTTTTTTTTAPSTSTTSVPPTSNTTTTTTAPTTTTTVPPTSNTTTTTTAPTTTTTTTSTTVPASTTPTTTTVPPSDPASRDEGDGEPTTPLPSVASPAPVDGPLRSITFPVAGPVTYFDDFGACRDGCRRQHEGNDIIGDRLQPLRAMHDGVIDHLVDHPTAGFGVVIRDSEGWEYRVYHVNNDDPGTDNGHDDGTWRYAEGIVPGATVHAGQLIGWMGDSGNAEGSVPHAHVEIRRPDGAAINPYGSLRYAQRDVNCRIELTTDASASDWGGIALPAGWRPLSLTGGHPGSGEIAARMIISPLGYTPVDAAAVRVGDPRYDDDATCPESGETGARQQRLPAQLAVILATIRALESGGDYTAAASSSTASGAYQFLDSTWAGYGGYRRAMDAPPAVQDAKAAAWATTILDRNGGDVTTVPVSWYIGHVPVGEEWDTVPAYPGNTLTPREYQRRWLEQYGELIGRPGTAVTSVSNWTPVDTSAACGTVLVLVGGPDSPSAMLTQAQHLAVDAAGNAVPAPDDPCDPSHGHAPAEAGAAAAVTERPFDER
jgi:murein DD-endopeptidase MepM/ murein hydrolase activator NlpD